MSRKPSPRSLLLLAVLILGSLTVSAAVPSAPAAAKTAKVSAFGRYSGYSEPVYDGWVRSSRYVAVRDGTRLAVDVFRPSRGGKVATEKLPVVWTHHRYRRTPGSGALIDLVPIWDLFDQPPVAAVPALQAAPVRRAGPQYPSPSGRLRLRWERRVVRPVRRDVQLQGDGRRL